ncbi:MAG: T9SS type A sorting domain-containing protein [Ignavibacteria bacterium]|nr:T9SS type A sorting domain-containing protein [Ignavibacteria bacterium]
MAVSGNVIFACTEKDGIFINQDLGQTWRNINYNLGLRSSVSRLFVSGNDLYGATYTNSVIKAPISNLVGTNSISTEVPDKFTLGQNYPNPFNPNTVINYNLPVAGFISLKVYDILGNEVATLVNTRQNAGSYSEEFDAGYFKLSSGVYFYKLQSGEFSETKRMVLVK